MNLEQNIDAESVTRNKKIGAFEHLQHLLKIGWSEDTPLIKNFLKENNLTDADLLKALENINKEAKK